MSSNKKSDNSVWWTVGAAAVVVAVGGYFYFKSRKANTSSKTAAEPVKDAHPASVGGAEQVGAYVAANTNPAAIVVPREKRTTCSKGSACDCLQVTEAKRQNKPYKVDLSEKDVYICKCGQSKNFPYCDGSHRAYNAEHGTNFSSQKYPQTNDKVIWVCGCGHSKNKPECDGSHKKVTDL